MKMMPLGDEAFLVYLPSEADAVRFTSALREACPHWLQDVVPAYASVGVFFDAAQIDSTEVRHWLNARSRADDSAGCEIFASAPQRHFRIPVCYEFALDLPRIREHTGLSPDDVIRLHTSSIFTIYAIGFVPGFPYLGYLPDDLCGVPRLASPRLRVEAGSVGLTARQTGIYPLARPGGWNLLGRTPLTIVDVAAGYFPMRVGDTVQFERIDEKTYHEQEGERLA